MRGAISLTKVSGIDIRVHVSFVLILLLNAWQWSEHGARGALFGAGLSALIFACVVLHELGHSLVAQALGITVADITLYPIGGVARLASRPKTPGQELLIALAGPAVNVVLAFALTFSGLALFGGDAMRDALKAGRGQAPTGVTLWTWLAASNTALALFNMLPALPMDGGRVLRAVLAWPFGQQRATKAAAFIGRLLAVGLFALGLWSGNFVLPFIALFVFFGAAAEVRDTNFQRMLDGVRSGDAVNSEMLRFSPSTTISEAAQAFKYWPASAFAVEHFGRLAGVVTREAILESVRSDGGMGYVAGLMHRQVPRVQRHDSLELSRQKMGDGGFVAVFDGELYVGLITEAELAHQLTVLQALAKSAASRRFTSESRTSPFRYRR